MIEILLIVLLVVVMTYLNAVGLKVPFGYLIVFLACWMFAGTAANFSVDYSQYKNMYDNPNHLGNLFLEPCWLWIADSLRYFGFASRMWFLLVSLVTLLLFFYGIKRMSPNFYLSVLMFLVCGFLTESMNGIRQYLAMAILFAAFPWILEGKTWKYLIAVLIAAQFHLSAYLMVVLIFVVKQHYPKWLLLTGLIISFIIGKELMDFAFTNILTEIDLDKFNNYSQNVDHTSVVNSGFLKIFFLLIGGFILFLFDKINKLNEYNYLYVNMVMIGIMIYNVFFSFQVAMRIYWYLFPFIIVLFPMTLQCMVQRLRLIAVPLIIILFAAFWLKMISQIDNYSFDFNVFE